MKIWIITQDDQDSNQSTSRIMNEDHTDHFILWHGEIRPTIWMAAIQIADPRKHCDLDNPVIDMDIISGKSIKQQAGDEPQIIKILHKWRNVIIEFLFFFFYLKAKVNNNWVLINFAKYQPINQEFYSREIFLC